MLRTKDLHTLHPCPTNTTLTTSNPDKILLFCYFVEFGMGGRFGNDTVVDDVSCCCSRKPILLLHSVPPPPLPTPTQHVDDKIMELVGSSLGRGERS